MSEILYNKSNQVLMRDGNTIRLYSYQTLVLEIVDGKETINGYGKHSVTTSKHITQAKSFLGI